ncbi:hypothetical protein BSKO_12287 [Bryopsis sp. KO-2023]|nr:hypothetical protein BSKO_12287 [Bryopsis sp. KO-2023]
MNQFEVKEAVDLTPILTLSNALGLKENTPTKRYFDLLKQIKEKHPRHVVLVRVGNGYEAVGIDAAVCIELIRGGSAKGIDPPKVCYKETRIDDLVEILTGKGFAVVVCEKDKSNSFQWFVSQFISAANPWYVNRPEEDVEEGGSVDLSFEIAKPIIGVARGERGFDVAEYKAGRNVVECRKDLTKEAVWACIESDRLAPPLHIHESCCEPKTRKKGSPEPIDMVEWETQIASMAPTITNSLQVYESTDWLQGFTRIINEVMGIPEIDAPIKVVEKDLATVRKPSFNTISQLGLAQHKFGAVSILDCMVPRAIPKIALDFIRRSLIVPPPLNVCKHIHGGCRELLELEEAVPTMVHIPPMRISRNLAVKTSSHRFYCDLYTMVSRVLMLIETHEELAATLLQIARYEAMTAIDLDELKEACLSAQKSISDIVKVKFRDPVQDAGHREDMITRGSEFFFNRRSQRKRPRRSIRTDVIKNESLGVEKAEAEVRDALSNIWQYISQFSPIYTGRYRQVSITMKNEVVGLRLSNKLLAKPGVKKRLVHPRGLTSIDKKTTIWSTEALEDALEKYRDACLSADAAATAQLQELGESLSTNSVALMTAAHMSVITTALICHVQRAHAQGWVIPDISRFAAKKRGDIEIEGFWPYWMKKMDDSTVVNDISIRDMIMLTGPNMGGKSTVLRSTAAVCLLGMTGFLVPAERASLPFLDNVVLRAFIGDNPAKGESGFSVEMAEVASVLREATKDSLVMLDELGKGTEIFAGACMSGAVLEELAERGCKGVFASHLHHLKYLPIKRDRVSLMKMDITAATAENAMTNGEAKKPTWKITQGFSEETLAMEVARQAGIPHEIVDEAVSLNSEFSKMGARGLVSGSHIADAGRKVGFGVYKENGEAKNGDIGGSNPGEFDTPISDRDLEDAQTVLKDVLVSYDMPETVANEVYQIPPGTQAPPRTSQMSCVYIIRWPDAQFYVGESDSLVSRMSHHRSRRKEFKDGMEVIYVGIPKELGSKSMAKRIESATINRLKKAGFYIQNDGDGRNISFGSA